MPNPEQSLAWTPPPARRRWRTAVVLVGLSSAVGVVYSGYEVVLRTLEEHAIHARHSWHQPLPISVNVLLGLAWFCSFAFLIPASSIGASELMGRSRGGRPRAAAFVALLCVGAVAQYVADLQAHSSSVVYSAFAGDAWLHDGSSWFALASLLAIFVFVGTATLLKPERVRQSVSTG